MTVEQAFKALLMQRLDDSSAITKGEIFYYLAETHHRQGDDKKAIQMLERALDTDKNLEKAKTMLAKLKNGDVAGSNADISAARTIQAGIGDDFVRYGVRASN